MSSYSLEIKFVDKQHEKSHQINYSVKAIKISKVLDSSSSRPIVTNTPF